MVDLDEKYYPHKIAWIVLNRLKEFNDTPQLIRDLSAKGYSFGWYANIC